MRILQLHCNYTNPGGEDVVAEAEAALLRSHGHEVAEFRGSNTDATANGLLNTARVLASSSWNHESARRVRRVIRAFRPDLVHVHNFWFALSPAILGAAKAEGVPTVMTLHNYRLMCPAATLMRRGEVCERCLGTSTWGSVPLRCYRNSMLQTAIVANMVEANRRRGTWDNLVDAYIALTAFSRDKFVEGGLPAARIHVKPNFLPQDPGRGAISPDGALFVGRLSPEKGVHTLLDAWQNISDANLEIAGDGPERPALQVAASGMPNVTFLGQLERGDVLEKIKRSGLLVMPSLWYEGFPLVLLEAYACGRLVVASRLGALAELIDDGRTGLLFAPGDAGDLSEKIRYLIDRPRERERMGQAARTAFERKYGAGANYEKLMEIYENAMTRATRCGRLQSSHAAYPAHADGPGRFGAVCIAGVNVSRASYKGAASAVISWARNADSRYICVCSAHGIVTAASDTTFRDILNAADIVTPDGMPVVWMARWLGARAQQRVYGPDLMLAVSRACAEQRLPIFLYGSTDETLERLKRNLKKRFPGLSIAGAYAPPFRPLSRLEDRSVVERIASSGARVVFVGLSTPRQEYWMHDHLGRVKAVMIGVGAAFDFHAGTVRQAPAWMQQIGLEWFYRLLREPRRLWRRYVCVVPKFVLMATAQLIGASKGTPSQVD